MPIYKGTLKTGAAYKGSTSLSRIYKGAYLVFEAFQTLIAEGVPPLTLLNCAAEIMLGYRIYGNSIQNGTPTPSAPVEIESVGDKTKNLFDYKYFFNNKTEGAGVVVSTNDAIVYILKPNTNYTVSTNYPQKTVSTTGSLAAVFFAKSGNYTSPNTTDDGLWEGQTRTITTDTEGRLFIACRNSKSTVPAPTLEEFSSGQYWIQLEEGSTATSYEPYGYRIPIKNASPNLLPYPYDLETSTIGGIEVTINDDGSIKLNGTATGFNVIVNASFRLKAGTYTISGNPSPNVNLWLRVVGSSTSAYYVRNYNGIKGTLTIAEDSDMYVYITINTGATVNNVTIYPMVNEGETDLEYSKYFAPETTNIYLDEPLRKIGNALPDGYTQLGYIATSSSDTVNAYIDTGLYANPNLRINTEIEFISRKAQASIFRSGADFWSGVYLSGNLRFAYTYQDDAGNYTTTSITAANGTRYNIDFDGKQRTLKINNDTITILGSPATKTSTKTLPLLGRIGGDGASVYSDFYGKLYHAKIYDNDILARDFIPCKNSSNVVGLYDLVNGVFYSSANTVDFVAGPTVYADYMDFETQKVVRNVEVIDDTGTLPIEQSLQPLVPPVEQSVTLPDILLNRGTNIVSIGTSVQPSNMWIKYKGKA